MILSVLKSNTVGVSILIVIVDNASTVPAEKQLFAELETIPIVVCISSKDNHGYFGGLNIGVQYILSQDSKYDFILVGNNDLLYSATFFQNLKSLSAKLNNYTVIAPNIITSEGIPQNPHVVKGISLFRQLIYSIYYSNYRTAMLIVSIRKALGALANRNSTRIKNADGMLIYSGHGSCYILTQDYFSRFDSLPSYTFLFFEEAILSMELQRKGGTIYYEPSLKIHHHSHASLSKLPSKELWRIASESYAIFRNRLRDG